MSRYVTGRRRGAPAGSRNALKDGRFSAVEIEARRLRGRLLRQLAASRRILAALRRMGALTP